MGPKSQNHAADHECPTLILLHLLAFPCSPRLSLLLLIWQDLAQMFSSVKNFPTNKNRISQSFLTPFHLCVYLYDSISHFNITDNLPASLSKPWAPWSNGCFLTHRILYAYHSFHQVFNKYCSINEIKRRRQDDIIISYKQHKPEG